MPNRQKDRFDQTYQNALGNHLAHAKRGAKTSRNARRIGKDATSLGLNAIDLAQTHELAMRRLGPIEKAAQTEQSATRLSRSTRFYVEALVPLEQERVAQKSKARQVEKKLQRQLRHETSRHHKLLAQAQRQRLQVRQLTHRFLLAQEADRKELSRDLHDEIAQVLAGINVRLTALKESALIGQRDLSSRIDQTQKLVEQSVAAVHRHALRLRPSLLDDLGLVPSIRSCIRNLAGGQALDINFKAEGSPDSLSNEQRTALYRVVQEALTNVVRHAKAKTVWVNLRKSAKQIKLEVRDDGKSFNPKRILNSKTSNRLGLLGMRERMEMLEGTFSIDSAPGQGTTITAILPLTCDASTTDEP